MPTKYNFKVGDIIRIKENHGGEYVGATGRVLDYTDRRIYWQPITGHPRIMHAPLDGWSTEVSHVELFTPAAPPAPFTTNVLGDFPVKPGCVPFKLQANVSPSLEERPIAGPLEGWVNHHDPLNGENDEEYWDDEDNDN